MKKFPENLQAIAAEFPNCSVELVSLSPTEIKGLVLNPLKTCKCGMTFTLKQWIALPKLGRQKSKTKPLELRDCKCGSTISVAVIYEDEDSIVYQSE